MSNSFVETVHLNNAFNFIIVLILVLIDYILLHKLKMNLLTLFLKLNFAIAIKNIDRGNSLL